MVLRPETEWVELVNDGTAIVADANERRIMDATSKLIGIKANNTNQFGDGHAAETIIKTIIKNIL